MATHSSILAWKIPCMEEPVHGYSPWGCKKSDITEQLHFTCTDFNYIISIFSYYNKYSIYLLLQYIFYISFIEI